MQFFRLQIKQSVFLWSIKCHTRENNGCDFGCLSLGTVSHHTSPLQSFADPGEGPAPLLFLDQTEDQRAEKIFLENSPPPPPSQGLDDPRSPCSDLFWLPVASRIQHKLFPMVF